MTLKLIADNLRITKPAVRKALRLRDPSFITRLAQKCEKQGAWAIDVNTGPLGKYPEKDMKFFINAVQQATDRVLLIDTANPAAMRAGLEAAANTVIINGFSLEPVKLKGMLPLAKEFDTDIIGFLLFPDSRVPKNLSQRCEIALELFEKAESSGIAKEKIIIDPVTPPLAWEDGIIQAREVLRFIRILPELAGFPVRTIAGISNLATRAENREAKQLVTKAYLAMLAEAGLTHALMDIFDDRLVRMAKAAGILASENLFSWTMLD
jgi:5-methyltetrahydrofolate corrinoid/iron sulfur protein methyltransferase